MNTPTDKEYELKRLRFRQRIMLFVISCCAADVCLLAAFAALGTISGWLVVLYGFVGFGATGAALVAIRNGTSQRFADPYMTAFQLGAASLLQLGGLVLAPQIALVFLNNQFVIFTMGTFRLRQVTPVVLVAIIVAIGVLLSISGALLVWTHGLAGSVTTGRGELALFWVSYMSTLGRSNLIAWFGSAARQRLGQRNRELARSVEHANYLASHDGLTGVLNRATLLGLLAANRDGTGGCVALLDLDDFKQVNDRYGHLVGDRVLERFAREARQSLHDGDLIGRYGGEEFVIVFRNGDCVQAQVELNRLLERIAELDWIDTAAGLTLTVSAGFSAPGAGENFEAVIHRADVAMYAAKHLGGNRALPFDASLDGTLVACPRGEPATMRATSG
ncbi:MAG: GGDEF domain-containing protein [Dokdonella sp.]